LGGDDVGQIGNVLDGVNFLVWEIMWHNVT